MEVNTWHRTEVRLEAGEWFVVRHPRDGLMQVRKLTAQWSSDRTRPRLDLDGVFVRRDGTPDPTRPAAALVLTWEVEAGPIVRQLPKILHTILEAVGMDLPF